MYMDLKNFYETIADLETKTTAVEKKSPNTSLALQRHDLDLERAYPIWEITKLKSIFFLKSLLNVVSNFFIPGKVSYGIIHGELKVAEEQRKAIASVKIQRMIVKLKNKLFQAISSGKTMLMFPIGSVNAENGKTAEAVALYYKELGLKDISLLTVDGKIYIYMEMDYN